MTLRRLILLPALVVSAGLAGAQTPGMTFKIRTQLKNHPAPEKAHPDSVRLKRLAAAAAARAADDAASGDAGGGGGGGGGGAPGRGAGGTGQNNVLMMNGAFIKGRGRMDVAGVIGRPELQATEAALFTDTTSTVVDDVAKTYLDRVFDIGSILAFTRAVDTPGAVIGKLQVSWDSLPAETYEGRPAKHYRMHMVYGLGQRPREDSLKMLAITDVVSDYWVEDLPVNFENRFAGIGRPRRQVPDSLRGEWNKMLDLYSRLGRGTIVKFQAEGVIGQDAATATEYTRTMEMTNITTGPVDEKLLQVPADYTRINPGRGRGG